MGSTWKFGSSNYSEEAICLGVRSSWSSLDALVLKAIAIVLTEHLKPHISDREHVTFTNKYLYSWLKTLYLRAFNYLLAKSLKLCIFKSDILPSDQCFHLAGSGGMKVTVWEG
jgi:hypothetical protein